MYVLKLLAKPNETYGIRRKSIPSVQNVFRSDIASYKRFLMLFVAGFLFVCFSSNQAFCQQDASSNWKLLKKEGNVNFYYKIGKCNKENAIMLRISNEGKRKINGTWTLNLQEEANTVQFIGVFENMGAGQTQTGSCKSDDPYLLIPYKVYKNNPPKITVDIQLARQ